MARAMAGYIGTLLADVYGIAQQAEHIEIDPWLIAAAVVNVEAYSKNGLVRTIDYRDFELATGIWTARTIEVNDVARKSRTVLKYDKLEYNLPLKEDDFTLQALRRSS